MFPAPLDLFLLMLLHSAISEMNFVGAMFLLPIEQNTKKVLLL